MTTKTPKCRAQGGAANCTDPNCPEKRAQKAAFLADLTEKHPRKLNGESIRYAAVELLPLLSKNGKRTTDGKFKSVESVEIASKSADERAYELVLEGPDGRLYKTEYYQSKTKKYEDPFFARKVFLTEVY